MPGNAAGLTEDLMIVEAAKLAEDQKQAKDKPKIAKSVDDEGLLSGICRRGFIEVKANQQLGRQTYCLPPDKELEKVIPKHQHQH